MEFWKHIRQAHLDALHGVEIRDLKIVGAQTIRALEIMDVHTVQDLISIPSLAMYESFFPSDVYENIQALQRVVLFLSSKSNPSVAQKNTDRGDM